MIEPAREWEEIAGDIRQNGGVTMLLGDVDVGKSTLARYLAEHAAGSGAVTVVDSDVGQSGLCLPGTISTAIFRSREEAADYRCGSFSFVGTANPVKAFTAILNATAMFVARGRATTGRVIVDTSGLVMGRIGRGMKLAKIRRINPDRVIAIQRSEECEEILDLLDEVDIYRLTPAPRVMARSRIQRTLYRTEKMLAFLPAANLTEHLLPDVPAMQFGGRPTSLLHLDLQQGTVIGLNHDSATLDVGVISEAGRPPLVRCRLRSLGQVNRIVCGDLAIDAPSFQ